MPGEKLIHHNKPFFGRIDKVLAVSLLLGFIFSIYGISWGRVESWNADQMVFYRLHSKGGFPLQPVSFERPPFHSYFNFFLSKVPVHGIRKVFNLSQDFLDPVELIWSRILTTFLFLGSIVLLFIISRRFFSTYAARIVTIMFSTSAGFIAFSHFLTADIPLVFWMLLAFYFAQNIILRRRTIDYILAGFLTGIATATKYNGLAVGLAIVAAHTFTLDTFSLRRLAFDKKLLLGLSFVIIGFIVGNPYALFDFPRFYSDFMYNYITAPVYSGKTEGYGYWKFILYVIEVIGLPMFFLVTIALIYSFYSVTKIDWKSNTSSGVIISLLVYSLYYLKIGSFPRLETRFVMPAVPYLFIASCPLWEKLKSKETLLFILLSILLIYNIVCCYYVGKRFREDPRMEAQLWVKSNIATASTIESSRYSPTWNKINGVELHDVRMPSVSGRAKIFSKLFERNNRILKIVELVEPNDEEKVKWYTIKELERREPSYIAVNSIYYSRFLNGKISKNYPSIKKYFSELLNEHYPYKIVFDQNSPEVPDWIYPKHIDFLKNRMIIFKRKNPT